MTHHRFDLFYKDPTLGRIVYLPYEDYSNAMERQQEEEYGRGRVCWIIWRDAMRERVRDNLQNAYGDEPELYHVDYESAIYEARSLISYAADLEDVPEVVLVPLVREWELGR